MAGLMEGIAWALPSLQPFLQACHRILIWCAIVTVSQFAVCSLAILILRNLSEVGKAYRHWREGQ